MFLLAAQMQSNGAPLRFVVHVPFFVLQGKASRLWRMRKVFPSSMRELLSVAFRSIAPGAKAAMRLLAWWNDTLFGLLWERWLSNVCRAKRLRRLSDGLIGVL